MTISKGDAWLGVPDAARELGVVDKVVYRLIDKGEFPGYRFGQVIRIWREEFDTYLESLTPDGATDR